MLLQLTRVYLDQGNANQSPSHKTQKITVDTNTIESIRPRNKFPGAHTAIKTVSGMTINVTQNYSMVRAAMQDAQSGYAPSYIDLT